MRCFVPVRERSSLGRPWLDPEVGTALFEAALRSGVGHQVFIDVPADNAAASRWAESKGLYVQRRWMRMRRGQPVHDHPAHSGPVPGPRTADLGQARCGQMFWEQP